MAEHDPAPTAGQPRASAVVDLEALRRNVAGLKAAAGAAEVMAVVKADAYSHGLLPSAEAALRGGATWLGVAVLDEALALRAGGVTAPVLAWLFAPGEQYATAIAESIDLAVHGTAQLRDVAAAAVEAGATARVHLKVDTGMGRGGTSGPEWRALVTLARSLEAEGAVRVEGVWSHLACADEPANPANQAQLAAFADAVEVAERAGLTPSVRHIANSAATLTAPSSHYDLVRPGLATYGINPLAQPERFEIAALEPVMRLCARIAHTKRVPQGTAVSYSGSYLTTKETTLAIVPLGYADGVPRSASGSGPVQINGNRYRVTGRVCMDQFVVDVGDADVQPGDEVTLFGSGGTGEPCVTDWATLAGTIPYELLTRVGGRVTRVYLPTV